MLVEKALQAEARMVVAESCSMVWRRGNDVGSRAADEAAVADLCFVLEGELVVDSSVSQQPVVDRV